MCHIIYISCFSRVDSALFVMGSTSVVCHHRHHFFVFSSCWRTSIVVPTSILYHFVASFCSALVSLGWTAHFRRVVSQSIVCPVPDKFMFCTCFARVDRALSSWYRRRFCTSFVTLSCSAHASLEWTAHSCRGFDVDRVPLP